MYLLKLLHSNFFKNQSKYYKGQKQCTYLHFSFKSSKLSLTCLSRRLQLLFKYNEIVFAESKVYFRPSNLPTTSTLIEFCLKNKKTKINQTKKAKIPTPLPGVGIGSSTLLQRGVLQQWDTVWTPSLVEGEQTNGLSRGIRSISAIHILLRIILSAVRVTEAKHTPSVTHVKLSFVHSWQ